MQDDNNKNKSEFEETSIVISLNNFNYSNSRSGDIKNGDTVAKPKFFGRSKELKRLIDHLDFKKNSSGSFLVSGYRGVGKTRFVDEVLHKYESKQEVIKVPVNLGSDNNLDSNAILSKIIILLTDCIENEIKKKPYSIIHALLSLLSAFLFKSLPRFFLVIFSLIVLSASSIFIRVSMLSNSNVASEKQSNRPDLLNSYTEYIRDIDYFFILLISCFVMVIIGLVKYLTFKFDAPIKKLRKLHQEVHSTTDSSEQIGGGYWSSKKNTITKPLDNNQIESRLRNILNECKSLEVIFIFDELDKISGSSVDKDNIHADLINESRYRKKQVDSILGDLKNLITNSRAKYIFIGGRDIYDAYLAERGSSNSLYESLFNDYIYLPSLLTDRRNQDYLLDGMIEAYVVSNLIPEYLKKEILRTRKSEIGKNHGNDKSDGQKKNKDLDDSYLKLSDYSDYVKYMNYTKNRNKYDKSDQNFKKFLENKIQNKVSHKLIEHIHILKTFIHFLTLHSWGNCKRLFTLFESFVRCNENGEHELFFSTKDIQRLVLSSHLYILFHHNLSRMLMNADDKLLVSSFSVFHYIMKYHGIGFSRGHILRMYETINIHSSPELTRIVDMIIHHVFKNHVRKIRNSFYRYRFSFLHEQEIHFITTINDSESAAFSFSLDAMDAVKQHYRNLIKDSQYTQADQNYGVAALSSIHVIVGNFHFWEQSYDEANIHYGIAMDMLEKSNLLNNDLTKIEIILQQIEIFLKQGSVAERVGNYSAAASIYMHAETIANNCLKNIDVVNQDSKWDILRQPQWAKHFLNLKQSAIHFNNPDHIVRSENEKESDVFVYRKAVLSLFMENFPAAFSGFIAVANSPQLHQDSERACFLKGNAYLKAGISVLLEYSNRLHKRLEDVRLDHVNSDPNFKLIQIIKVLVESTKSAINGISITSDNEIYKLEDFGGDNKYYKDIERAADDKNVLRDALTLINLSASNFKKGRLNVHAATSYMAMVMMWEAFLEMILWLRDKDEWRSSLFIGDEQEIDNYLLKIKQMVSCVRKQKSWIFEAQDQAFICTSFNTGSAFDHFIKTTWKRNLGQDVEDSLYGKVSNNNKKTLVSRDRVLSSEFLTSNLYQHYSVFGQALTASIYWDDFAANHIFQRNKTDSLLIHAKLLPFGIRYYSTMLWLKGRAYLNRLVDNAKKKDKDMKNIATKAIINLYRSSQYVLKTHGENASMVLPPLFIIYYNMWEVLFKLVSISKTSNKISFEQAVVRVRDDMDNLFKEKEITDVSTRMLDLHNVEQMALAQLKIIERMGDQNSSDRTSILRNKYYLDDDYEDNSFNLDWCYCRFFAPAAIVYSEIIKNKMKWLKDAQNSSISNIIG